MLIGAGTTAWADDTFKRIASTDDLELGAEYIIVSENNNVAMGIINSNDKGEGVSVTISNSQVTLASSSTVNVLTLGGNSTGYTLRGSRDKKYIGYNSSTNMQSNTTVSSNSYKWTINFNGGDAAIANVATKDRYIRGYDSGKDFRPYTVNQSGSSNVQLYKKTVEKSVPTPVLNVANNSQVQKGTTVTITNLNTDYHYYYTLDGSTPEYDVTSGDPTGTTIAYNNGITINDDVTVKVLATDFTDDSNVAVYNYELQRTAANLEAIDDFELEVTETHGSLYTSDSNGEVTFESSDFTVATVNAGVVTAIKPGTAVITIRQAKTDTYAADEATVTVTVTTADATDPVGPAVSTDGYYELVTDASSLSAGNLLLFVSGTNALSTQNEDNRSAVTVTFNDDGQIISATNAQIITLEGETDKWYFNVGNDTYLYAASTSKNYLRTGSKTSTGKNSKATISISNSSHLATIKFQGTNENNYLRYNPNNGNPIFACYSDNSTTGSEPKIYRYVAGNSEATFDIAIGSTGWRTLYSSANVSLPEGVTGYIVTASSASTATLTEISTIPAYEPVILKATPNTYTLTIADADDCDDVSGNLLEVSTETTGNGVYVLANKGNGVGFYLWKGGSLGAGRVYLPAPAATAREFIGFGDATGIGATLMNSEENVANNGVYDLQGRKIANDKLPKGIYIVNGNKVIIK